jgi:hypothetical protein
MNAYSFSSLQTTTKYGIAGFLMGAAGAYSLCSIWSDTGSSSGSSSSSSSSRSSSSGSGYDDNNSYNQSSSSMFGGKTNKHRKKGHNKTRNK